jgi:hypothetical protein
MKCFDCNLLIRHYKKVYVYRASTDFIILFLIGFPLFFSRYVY